MNIDGAMLAIAALTNIGLGLFVFTRNPRSRASLSFFLVSLSIALWSVSNFLTDHATELSVNSFFNRLAYFFALHVFGALLLFSLSFPISRNIKLKSLVLFLVPYTVISVLSLTDMVAGRVTSINGELEFGVGSLTIPYALLLLVLLAGTIINLRKAYKRGHKREKQQIKLIILGVSVASLLGLLTNLLIPIVAESWHTTRFGPVLTVVFVGAVAYAIIKHQLFDVRLVVARSVAYIMALAVIGALYGFVAFYLFDRLIFESGSMLNPTQRLVYVMLALISGLLFAPAKKVFDKFSNSVFYRDNYDPQWFINDLTVQITKHADLRPLLDGSSISIIQSLKPEKIAFVIRLSEEPGDVYIHTTEKNLPTKSELAEMSVVLAELTDKIIVTNTHEQLPSRVRSQLRKYDVAVLVKLVSGSKRIGYLALGDKKSGNAYNRRDVEVLEIISDELAIAIENALRFDQIQKFNDTLQQEVEDATRRLRYTNTKLRVLDETKDEFVSMASHQLRTPLTSVKGYLSMVLEGDAGDLNQQQKKLLTQAFISSERMNYLISDLLNVSRLKTGKFIMERSPTYLPDIIGSEIGQLKQIAEAKGLELIFDKPDKFPMLSLDETKIRQVIMNFIDNALHYTPSGGKVKVSLVSNSSSVEFRVVDTGLGVPRAEQHKLFGKFYRATNAKSARPDGNGLGLFMARKVIVGQGGAVIFKSQEGKGSTFGFTFPRNKTEIK